LLCTPWSTSSSPCRGVYRGKAAAFASSSGGLWGYSHALSSPCVRSECCLGSMITGDWEKGEEGFIISLPLLSKKVCFMSADQRLIWEIRIYLGNKALSRYSFGFFFSFPFLQSIGLIHLYLFIYPSPVYLEYLSI